ncbi:MAG: hypothetical protein DWI00_06200 [Planctomycetota bacterium]|nr:MAG: hypothetical protein DWI00_06200 [Planctomycetota bacterium]
MLVLLEQPELLQLEVQVHQRQLELLLLERQLVQLFRKPRLHIQCWRHMLNRMMIHSLVCRKMIRSCYHMMIHS